MVGKDADRACGEYAPAVDEVLEVVVLLPPLVLPEGDVRARGERVIVATKATFTEVAEQWYESKRLGRTRRFSLKKKQELPNVYVSTEAGAVHPSD